MKVKIKIAEKGGAGSGNWGHAGRPGMVGGSAPTIAPAIGAQMTILKGRTAAQRQEEARRGKPTGSAFSDSAPGNEAAEGMLSTSKLTVNEDVNYSPGINVSRVVDIEGDGKAIIKPMVEMTGVRVAAFKEASAYEVAKALGWDDLVPPTVVRSVSDLSQRDLDGMSAAIALEPTDTMSVQLWTDNAIEAGEFGGWGTKPDAWRNVDTRSLGRIALLDGVIANSDRHEGNFLIKDNRAIAIDNGISMGVRGEYSDATIYSNRMVDSMKGYGVDATPHPADVAALSNLRGNAEFRQFVDAAFPGHYNSILASVYQLQAEYGQKELDRVTIPIKVGPKPGQ